jgi:molecular chaperone DnaK
MAQVVGIDLGTTYCAMATLNEKGMAVTLPNSDGDILTPSAVYVHNLQAVVGQPALDILAEQPGRVATLIKRKMGQPEYGMVDGLNYRAETLSALILKKLAQDLEKRLGKVAGVVITVPAYYDDTRRKATQDAGTIAGLNVIDIIDEPTAAALAYAQDAGKGGPHQTVMVYDLGGGTFDVSIVRLTPKKFHVLAIEGDVRLGGHDFDERLVQIAANAFMKKYGTDPRSDAQSLAQLQLSAERAKRSLGKLTEASITVMHAGQKLAVPISREEFEQATRDLLLRTRATCLQVLKRGNLTWAQIDRVLLVGGSTHMPMTKRMLAELTGQEPDQSLAVSEVVARGAALHAGIKIARDRKSEDSMSSEVMAELEDIVEISVNAHSLGIEVRDRKTPEAEKLNDILIPKNSQLPASASRIYRTSKPSQRKVRVRVLQGEATQAEACIAIGECWITDLPKNLPRKSPIQVRCQLQANGMVVVSALDMTAGKIATATLHRTGGMTAEELQKQTALVKSITVQ